MLHYREERLGSREQIGRKFGSKKSSEAMQEREFAFNKTLEEETKQMAFIAKKLTQRGEY